MSALKSLGKLLVMFLALLGFYLVIQGPGEVVAQANPTPTLIASAWNYLPVVRGEQLGPTPLPPIPLPTLTPGPTASPSPTRTEAAQATATQTNTPTSTPSATATNTPVPANTATTTPTTTPKPPTATPKPPTATPRPTNTPTATSAPAGTGDVQITEILFDGAVPRSEADEYVEIKNFDNKIVQLKGWKLQDNDQNHTYTFPLYSMKPGETCRVYTNQNHPETCGFNWRQGSAVWNNDGDTATLKDGSGKVIDTCSYTGSGTKVRC